MMIRSLLAPSALLAAALLAACSPSSAPEADTAPRAKSSGVQAADGSHDRHVSMIGVMTNTSNKPHHFNGAPIEDPWETIARCTLR